MPLQILLTFTQIRKSSLITHKLMIVLTHLSQTAYVDGMIYMMDIFILLI